MADEAIPNRGLFRVKPLGSLLAEAPEEAGGLRRNLGAWELTGLGLGAIIGTGIFVVTGVVAARYAGPAITVSFLLAGLTAGLAALVYAELASSVPVAGSAYTYSYAAFGELAAWVIGWDLILEYTVAAGAVAIGWSGYVTSFLAAAGLALPPWASRSPLEGGVVNLPAAAIAVVMGILVARGTRESTRFNALLVAAKVGILVAFLALALPRVDPGLWVPFAPYGSAGVLRGAAIIFFAYIGFDAVSTAAEEVRRPGRDLPLGIFGSLTISTALYVLVAGALTGLVPLAVLDSPAPVADALLHVGIPWGAALVSAGALGGLTSVMLVNIYGQSRVFFAMARDGLLPQGLARIHPRWRTPSRITVLTAAAVAAVGGLLPLGVVAEMANIGTLTAFVLVSAGVVLLRYRHPDLPRPFRMPLMPVLPLAAAGLSLYLAANLPLLTWIRFVVWLVVGLTLYFLYGRHHSRLAPAGPGQSPG